MQLEMVALVVIGILIALQLNNWNAQRIEQLEIKGYAKSLIVDLEADIDKIQRVIARGEGQLYRIDSLANYVRNRSIDEMSKLGHYMSVFEGNLCTPWMEQDVHLRK